MKSIIRTLMLRVEPEATTVTKKKETKKVDIQEVLVANSNE